MPIFVQCQNCGKTIKRSPAVYAKNKSKTFYCNLACEHAYRKRSGLPVFGGNYTKADAIARTISTLPYNVPYDLNTIAELVTHLPGKHRVSYQRLGCHLAMSDEMQRVATGVWKRVEA